MSINRLVISLFITSLTISFVTAQERYGYGLPGSGSDKGAHTIFINPGEDCSHNINISWASPIGTICRLEVTEESTGKTSSIPITSAIRCETFDSIYSRLSNHENIYERHVFDKHGAGLVNLKPDTDYSFTISTTNPLTGMIEHSEPRRFHTAGAKSWSAAVIGDFHHYSPLWERLEAAMGMVDVIDSIAGGIDWVLSTGDQNAWGGSYNFWTELAEQPNYKNYLWAAVQGNHDHATRLNVKSDLFFRDSHYFPHNGYAGQEGITYWFRYGDVLFFMLNNEAMRTKESLLPVFNWMEWVINDNPSKYIVVVQHYEWLIGTNGANSQLDRFRDEFDKLGVDLAISGNNHAYIRTYPLLGREPVEASQGTFYVVTPSSDNNRGRALKPMKTNTDIVAKRWSEGAQTVGAMLMDVNPERIVMTLYDRYGNAQDSFTVPAKR